MTPSRLARALLDPQAVIGDERQDDRRLQRSLFVLGQQIEADAIEAAGARSALAVMSEVVSVAQAGAELGSALCPSEGDDELDSSPPGLEGSRDQHELPNLGAQALKLFGNLLAPLPAQLGRAMEAERAQNDRQRQLAGDLAEAARASAPKRA